MRWCLARNNLALDATDLTREVSLVLFAVALLYYQGAFSLPGGGHTGLLWDPRGSQPLLTSSATAVKTLISGRQFW